MIAKVIIPLFIVQLAWISTPAFAIDLVAAAQDSEPKYYKLEDNSMGGICVDIMKAIEAYDPTIKFQGYDNFMPFKRLQNDLKSGQLDVFFGLKKTAQRTTIYRFLDTPLYQLNYVIAIRRDDKIKITSWDDVRGLGEKGRVLTVFATAACLYIHQEGGLLVDDGAKTPDILLTKLLHERGRFAFYHDLGLRNIIKKRKLENKIRILPTSFSSYSHYAAFSKKTPVEAVNTVRAALVNLKTNGALGKIHRKYDLVE